jgi:tetratricopeptide (TPR) repeat protein
MSIAGLFIFLSLACPLFAQTPKDVFQQANQAYANGQFGQAATLYESARSQGLRHWVLDYNLGNAYYKAGQTGRAIASYLRAFRVNSHHGDLIQNLELALTRAGDPFLPQDAFSRLLWRAFYILSLNVLAVLVSALFIVVCLIGALAILGRLRLSVELGLAGVAGLVILGGWFGVRVWLNERSEGVVVISTAEIRGAPTVSAPANFTVPEGRRVLILKQEEPIKGWLEIGVPQEGLKGWVPDSAVEPV